MSHSQAKPTTPARLMTRLGVIVVAVSVLVAVVIYFGSHVIPASYSSSSDVVVNVTGSSPSDTSQAADTLAAQYAEQVTATEVLVNAGKAVGSSEPINSGNVSAGAVSAQNIIQISTSYGDPVVAQKVTAAVTTAFVDYINDQITVQARQNAADAEAKLKPLQAQVARLERQQAAALASKAANASEKASAIGSQLNTVQAQVSAAQAEIATNILDGQAKLSVAAVAGYGSKTVPQPKLYAMVGFIIALLIALRFAVVAYRRRFPKPAAPAGAAPTQQIFVSDQRLLNPPAQGQGAYLMQGVAGPSGPGQSAEPPTAQYFVVDGDVVTPVTMHEADRAGFAGGGEGTHDQDAPADVVPEHGPQVRYAPPAQRSGFAPPAQPSGVAPPAEQHAESPRFVAPPSGATNPQVEVLGADGGTQSAVPSWRVPTSTGKAAADQNKLARESAVAFGAAVLAGVLFPRRRGGRRGGRR